MGTFSVEDGWRESSRTPGLIPVSGFAQESSDSR